MKPLIEKLVQSVLQLCDPEEIILFGSWARGTNDAASDVDLLIVARFTESPALRRRRFDELEARFAVPLDLHLLRPEELAAAAADPASFPGSVRGSGVTLYRRGADPLAGRRSRTYDDSVGRT